MSRPLLLSVFVAITVLTVPDVFGQQFTSYTVKQGDTLYRIARTHYVTVESLRKLNDIEQDHIQPGQTLWIDGRPEPAGVDSLVVGAGETVVDSTVVSDTAMVAVGQDAVSVEDAERDSSDGDVSISIEFPPDTVSSSEAGTVADIITDSTTVDSAQVSDLPGPEHSSDDASGIVADSKKELFPHIVISGETLFSIAARYGGNIDTLVVYNPDHDTFLTAGDTVFVPWVGSVGEHRVKAGETLFRLSKNYGTSVQHIRELNGIVDDKIMTGMILLVPLRPGVEIGSDVQVPNSNPDEVLDTGKVRIYPDIFEGRLMANGKSYIADRFTVSHTSIALGTFVVVVDPSSGNQTFAEVTDRLPPGSDVIMEVSRAVANVLNLETEDLEVEVRRAH